MERSSFTFSSRTASDVVDGVAVPQPLEDRVGKAEHQDVLHRLLAQVVVDAEELLLVGELGQFLTEALRRRQVRAEGFLHDEPLPTGALFLGQQPRGR
jgi:hypothetical protein